MNTTQAMDTMPGKAIDFPIPRSCPFHPPNEFKAVQRQPALARVKLWNGNEAWLVTRYEDFRAVLKDKRFSADTRQPNFPSPTPGILVARGHYRAFVSMDEPEHNTHRRMLSADFSRKRIDSMRPQLQAIVDELVDELLAKPRPVDFFKDFALPFPTRVICRMLGVPYDAHEFFQERAEIMMSTTSTVEEAVKAGKELIDEYLGDLIDEKARHPGDDILSRLVHNHMLPGHISRGELLAMSRLLLAAGHETTANVTAMSVLTLLRHPEQLAELKAKPELIPGAIEELLRYLDPTQGGRRRVALEDVEIAGQLIRAGEAVVALNHVANRDELNFEDPDRFDIHRNVEHHVAFGDGIHQCLGQDLARAELDIVLSTLFRRIPTLRLAVPPEEVEFNDERVVYSLRALPIDW